MAGLTMLASCNDFLTGQDGEPHGPLKVTKLTLNDKGLSRPAGGVVTDTSVPADCSLDSVKDTPQCNADPFKDKYGVIKSPPNPDSAAILRVVFNKAPMNLNGAPLEPVPAEGLPSPAVPLKLADPSVLKLTCNPTTCSSDGNGNFGVPPSYNSLQLTGTDLSPDPSQYAYGPGLQMEVIATCPTATPIAVPPAVQTKALTKCQLAGPSYVTDPFRALEPGAQYSVVLNPKLQGRLADGTDDVQTDDAATKALLTFNTEAFQPVVAGIGGDADNQVADDTTFGDGSAATPYVIDTTGMDGKPAAQLANDGAVVLMLNAPADELSFTAQTATASVTVGGVKTSVPVVISTAVGYGGTQPDPKAQTTPPIAARNCAYGNRRSLYIAPVSGNWLVTPADGAVVNITIRGSEVRDLSQIVDQAATTALVQLYQAYNSNVAAYNAMMPAPMPLLKTLALPTPIHLSGKGVHVLGKDINIKGMLMPAAAGADYAGVIASDVVPPSGC